MSFLNKVLIFIITLYYKIVKLFTKPIVNNLNQPLKPQPNTNDLNIEKNINTILKTCGSVYYMYNGPQ